MPQSKLLAMPLRAFNYHERDATATLDMAKVNTLTFEYNTFPQLEN